MKQRIVYQLKRLHDLVDNIDLNHLDAVDRERLAVIRELDEMQKIVDAGLDTRNDEFLKNYLTVTLHSNESVSGVSKP